MFRNVIIIHFVQIAIFRPLYIQQKFGGQICHVSELMFQLCIEEPKYRMWSIVWAWANIMVRNHLIQKEACLTLQTKGRKSKREEVPIHFLNKGPLFFPFWILMLIIFKIHLRPERKAIRPEDRTPLTTLSILHLTCNLQWIWTPSS